MLSQLQEEDICYRYVRKEVADKESQSIMMYADNFACICETAEQLQKAINMCKKR